jgi:putative peptide zinc metalloprotease protein
LYRRFKAFDPDALLERLLPRVRFVFTRHFARFAFVLLLTALGIGVANSQAIAQDIARLYQFQTVFLVIATILCITIAHEFAHGLTCKYFGGRVREMGFMLLFFQPAFYCNVSDSWLFPEKTQRILVTFAGAYFELVLWSLAIIGWRVADPDTGLNAIALIIISVTGIRSFFNLNPLIKLDGYYMLSDYLEVPNLRARALSYIGARIKALWGEKPDSSSTTNEIAPRERRIFMIYGFTAATFSIGFLGWIASSVGGFLVGELQGIGFFLFVGLLLMVFGNMFKKIISKVFGLYTSDGEEGSRRRRRWQMPAILSTVLLVLFFGRFELSVSGEFSILPEHNADVHAQVNGVIEEVAVKEGDHVKKGDLLVRMGDRDYRNELSKLEAHITEKRARLRLLQGGVRAEEIDVSRISVDMAKTRHMHSQKRFEEAQLERVEELAKAEASVGKSLERLKYAKKDRDSLQQMMRQKLIAQKQLDEAEEEVFIRQKELEEAGAELKLALARGLASVEKELAVAGKQVEEAEGELNILLAGSRPEEIEAASSELVRLEVQRDYVLDQLARLAIRSPIDGIVTTPKLSEKLGQLVEQGDLIMEVYKFVTVVAEIYVPEKEFGDIAIGQEMTLKARAYPSQTFQGTISAIAPVATRDDSGLNSKIIRVSSRIANPGLLLKPEMTGNAKIYCGKRRIVDLVTRRLVRYLRVEFWSWW